MSIWSSLEFRAGKVINNNIIGINSRFITKKNGNLIYKNNRYNSFIIHAIKREAAQFIEQKVNSLLPKYQRYFEKSIRDIALKRQEANLEKLIEAGEQVDKGLGFIQIPGHKIIAKNKYGERVPEALMLYFESEKVIEVKDVIYQDGKGVATSYTTNVVCFIDLVASVTMQSAKNLVLTQVQGRDFTRKELISGGDLTFTVNGKIVGNERGVYPENEVKKFVQLAQYGGIIKVNHYLFQQFNVEQIIIKEFNLDISDCKNVQPYSFSCVAVEPDEDVSIITDTIGVLNAEIVVSPVDKWYKLILNNKLSSNTVTENASAGLDTLVSNI